MADTIIIAVSFDKGYAEQATVMLYSLLYNNTNNKLTIFIFFNDLDETTKNKIAGNLEEFSNFELHWRKFEESLIKSFQHRPGHVNEYTYTKIFVSKILPEFKRIIYLDCDMLVLKDIADLWRIDLKSKTVGVVTDPSTRHHEVGVTIGKNYFNAGMLVFDVKQWNQKSYSDLVAEKLFELGGKAWERDQDGLNVVLEHDALKIDTKWNTQSHHIAATQKEGVKNIRQFLSPAIVHFTGNLKPWNFKSSSPYKKDYYYYLAKTSFAKGHQPENKNVISITRRLVRNGLVFLHLIKY
jgi:lipopolysaccharide biosynthesis glycosyltransferase